MCDCGPKVHNQPQAAHRLRKFPETLQFELMYVRRVESGCTVISVTLCERSRREGPAICVQDSSCYKRARVLLTLN